MDCAERALLATKSEIEAYLVLHPAAADSVRGIQCWWLRETEVMQRVIELALEELVHDGVVTRTVLPDGTVVFSASDGSRSEKSG